MKATFFLNIFDPVDIKMPYSYGTIFEAFLFEAEFVPPKSRDSNLSVITVAILTYLYISDMIRLMIYPLVI